MYKKICWVLIILISICSYCVNKENTIQKTTSPVENGFDGSGLDLLVSQKLDIVQPKELETPQSLDEASTSNIVRDVSNNSYNCSTVSYKNAPGFNEISFADVNGSLIYPGAVFEAKSIENGVYIPLNAKRKPIKVSISALGLDRSSTLIEDPSSLSSTREALELFFTSENLNKVTPAANSLLSTFRVYNDDQLSRMLGFNVKADFITKIKAGIGIEFSTDTKKQKTQTVTQFIHKYYTIDIDLPSKPSDFFMEMPSIEGDNTPVYVSSIVYGRFAIMSTKSTKTETEIKQAYETLVNGLKLLNSNIEYKQKFNSLFQEDEVTTFVKGGDANFGSAVIDSTSMVQYLKNGTGSYYDAVPIAYKLNSLKDNTPMRIVLPTQYNVTNCTYVDNTPAVQNPVTPVPQAPDTQPSVPTPPVPSDEALSLKIFSAKGCCDVGGSDTEFYGTFKVGTTNLAVGSYNSKICSDFFTNGGHFAISPNLPSIRSSAVGLSGSNFINVQNLNWTFNFTYTVADAQANRNIVMCSDQFCDSDSGFTGDDCGYNQAHVVSLSAFKNATVVSPLEKLFDSSDFDLTLKFGK